MTQVFEIDTTPLNDETKNVAITELRETPDVVKNSLKELRKFLQNDSTIFFKDDDTTLTTILRPCKFYAKSAYELMKRISVFKKEYKRLLNNLEPNDEKEAITKYNIFNILPNRDDKGRRVLLVHAGGRWDPSKVTTDQVFRVFYLIQQAALLEPQTQVRGVVVLIDFHKLGMKQVLAFNPYVCFRLSTFVQNAMPLRLKEVHLVNQPFLFNIIWNVFKPFIKEKIRKRIFIHGYEMSSLHKYIKPTHLPEDFGGQLPKINYCGANWFPSIFKYNNHFKLWNSFGYIQK